MLLLLWHVITLFAMLLFLLLYCYCCLQMPCEFRNALHMQAKHGKRCYSRLLFCCSYVVISVIILLLMLPCCCFWCYVVIVVDLLLICCYCYCHVITVVAMLLFLVLCCNCC